MNTPTHQSMATPTAITVLAERHELEMAWADGTVSTIGFAAIRRFCACAWCRQAKRIGSEPRIDEIQVAGVNAVGTSGLQFVFGDGHDRGFYNWDYLRAIADGTVMERFHGH